MEEEVHQTCADLRMMSPPPSFREHEAMQIENEAVQNEVREAVQNEAGGDAN